MSDKVRLDIGTGDDFQTVNNFKSYKIESDIFMAGDAFQLTLTDPEIEITEGARCRLYINNQLELNGIVDRIEEKYSKSGSELTIKGRDLMGLLVDSYCEEFPTLENISLKALTEQLLRASQKYEKVPFIRRSQIKYMKGNKNRAVQLSEPDEDQEFTQIETGKTIFEALRENALVDGKLFFSLPDGTFVFGEPLTSGEPLFFLVNRKDGQGNNIIEGERVRDISKRYSKVRIIGQQQGSEVWETEDINTEGVVEDKAFPFYKPFVATTDQGNQDPKKYARIIMNSRQFEGFQLIYKTPGHSQDDENFQVNSICHVQDERYGIDNDYLVYGRVFERSKGSGTTTTLKLSKLGVLPA